MGARSPIHSETGLEGELKTTCRTITLEIQTCHLENVNWVSIQSLEQSKHDTQVQSNFTSILITLKHKICYIE